MYVFRRYVSNMMDLYCGQFLQLFISHAFCVVFVFSRGVFVVFNCWKHAFHELKRLFLCFFGHFVF